MRKEMLRIDFVAVIALVSMSCERDERIDQSEIELMSNEEVMLTTKIDSGIEVLGDLTFQAFEDEENFAKSTKKRWLPDCADVTVIEGDFTKDVTIDFGTEGCEGRNGHMLKGKIFMRYQRDTDAQSLSIEYRLEDFFIDEVQFVGSKTITRVLENENGNPERSMNLDLTIIFQDGTEVSRSGMRVREWVEGVLNGVWGDNVFLITGSWGTTFANGITHSTTITTPIRREASCRFAVSGVKEIVRTLYNGTLDYGDGACDNKAVFTNGEGEVREIEF